MSDITLPAPTENAYAAISMAGPHACAAIQGVGRGVEIANDYDGWVTIRVRDDGQTFTLSISADGLAAVMDNLHLRLQEVKFR